MPVVAAAAIGVAGSVYAGNQAKKGQKAAAAASQNATDQATAEQRRQYDLSRADNAPWLNVGRGALGTLAGLYGISTGAPAQSAQMQQYQVPGQAIPGAPSANGAPNTSIFAPGNSVFGNNRILDVGFGQGSDQTLNDGQSPVPYNPNQTTTLPGAGDQPQINGGLPVEMGADGKPVSPAVTPNPNPTTGTAGPGGSNSPFWASPDYQFRLNEQNRALTARNAALGIQDSGAAQRSALQLSGNLASGEYNNYANRLAALAGVGQTAAAQNQNLGQNYANSYGNLLTNNAQNLASSYQNQGAINGQIGQTFAGAFSNFANRWGSDPNGKINWYG